MGLTEAPEDEMHDRKLEEPMDEKMRTLETAIVQQKEVLDSLNEIIDRLDRMTQLMEDIVSLQKDAILLSD